MGDKVQNHPMIREHGRWGFLVGRGPGPNGPSLALAPDGRPWTHHITSPLVSAELMDRVCASARKEPSAEAWAVAVCDGAPAMGAWLVGLFPGEREGLWREARS